MAGGSNPRQKWRFLERGASAVEFAIVLPVLVVILFGIIEFSLLLYNQQVITNASREGARAGIVQEGAGAPRLACEGAGSISDVVDRYCGNHLITFNSLSTPEITCSRHDKDDAPGEWTDFTASPTADFSDDLRVSINYRFNFLLLPSFVSTLTGGLDLNALTVMRYE